MSSNRQEQTVAQSETTRQKPGIQSISYGRLLWINIENPTEVEIEYLAENYPFHKLELDDCLSRIQRPKIDHDEDDNYLFMVFHFPVFHKEARVTTVSQVSVFLGRDYLITLHEGNLKSLTTFFRDCSANKETQDEAMSHSPGLLLYLILDRLVTYCFPILNKIGSNIERVEDDIFDEDARSTVRELSMLWKDVISYQRMIKPQTEVFEWMEKSELPIIKEDADVYFGDLADHNRKIMDSLNEYKEWVAGLNDNVGTLTSFRINQVMRLLTVISVILLPLTLVAGIFGMNIYPLTDNGNPTAITAVLITMVVIVASMLVFFRVKRWI